jgi:hypothetical protein
LWRYFSNLNSKAVLATLFAFEVRFDIPVSLPSALAAARQVERWRSISLAKLFWL